MILECVVEERLVKYISNQISRGISPQKIKQELLAGGWKEEDIHAAFGLIQKQGSDNSSELPQERQEKIDKIELSPLKIALPIIILILVLGGVYFFLGLGSEITEEMEVNESLDVEINDSDEEIEEELLTSYVLDCGEDIDCLIEAARNCNNASVTNTVTLTFFGVEQVTTSHWEVKGSKNENCIFYLRTESITLKFPDDVPSEIVEQQEELYKRLEGRDGTCKFLPEDLVYLLSKWRDGIFEGGVYCSFISEESGWDCEYSGDWELAKDCKGTFFSYEI